MKQSKIPIPARRFTTLVLTSKRSYACAKIEPIPPEEFGIRKSAKNLRDATYVYHEPSGITESDLIAQGYDRNQVESLPTADEGPNRQSMARDKTQGFTGISQSAADKSMREVRVTEHYKVMDYEGDGRPSLYRITTGGEQFEVLKRDGKPDIEPIDVMPFAAATPVIMTHRFFGRSIADLVLDIQRIKTALLRSLLDNAYLANNQRVEVAETTSHERTLDDLLVNRPGGVVRVKQSQDALPLSQTSPLEILYSRLLSMWIKLENFEQELRSRDRALTPIPCKTSQRRQLTRCFPRRRRKSSS